MLSPEGQAVVVPGCTLSRKPCGPSFMVTGGMPSRSMALMFPTYAQLAFWVHEQHGPYRGPWSMDSFSAWVMLASRACARTCVRSKLKQVYKPVTAGTAGTDLGRVGFVGPRSFDEGQGRGGESDEQKKAQHAWKLRHKFGGKKKC